MCLHCRSAQLSGGKWELSSPTRLHCAGLQHKGSEGSTGETPLPPAWFPKIQLCLLTLERVGKYFPSIKFDFYSTPINSDRLHLCRVSFEALHSLSVSTVTDL